jgi:hypothetical protein
MQEIPISLSQYKAAGPRQITPAEFSAVDSIHAAHLALNAANLPLADMSTETSPMTLTRQAGISALAVLIIPQGMTKFDAVEIWEGMIDNGCNAQYNYEHVRFSNY